MIRSLIAQARRAQLNRRTLLAGAGAGATALALAACSTGGGVAKPTPAADKSSTDKTLNWANWAAYIDEDDAGNYPTLVAFTEETGIEVDYEVAVDDNNTYYGKVKDQLALGQDIGADTVVPHRLDDRPLDPASATRRSSITRTCRTSRTSTPRSSNPDFDPGRKYPCRGRAASPASAGTRRRCPAASSRSPTSGTPSSRAASACSPRCATRWASSCSRTGVDISGDWGDEEFTAAIDELQEQVPTARSATSRATRTSRT